MSTEPEVVFDDDNPEWTGADFARARPISEFPELAAAFARAREGQRAQEAEQVTLDLDKDVLERFRATGPDWQVRMRDALRAAAEQLDPSLRDAA